MTLVAGRLCPAAWDVCPLSNTRLAVLMTADVEPRDEIIVAARVS